MFHVSVVSLGHQCHVPRIPWGASHTRGLDRQRSTLPAPQPRSGSGSPTSCVIWDKSPNLRASVSSSLKWVWWWHLPPRILLLRQNTGSCMSHDNFIISSHVHSLSRVCTHRGFELPLGTPESCRQIQPYSPRVHPIM